MGYIVEEPSNISGTRYRTIPKASNVAVKDGHLFVEEHGYYVAIFTPGTWVSVVRDGDVGWQRTDKSGPALKIEAVPES